MKRVLKKLYILLYDFFHPSFRESVRKVGILEDMRCSAGELENLKRMLEEYAQDNGLT